MDEMKQLVQLLNEHATRYYVYDDPTISDKEYDVLYDRLAALEKETGIVLDDSPTRRVGGRIIETFLPHKHIGRLYSLDKAQTLEELDDFFQKIKKQFGDIEYTLEYKFDGLTLNLTYENKSFLKAATRGDGEVGEDVTQQALTIKSFPLSISSSSLLEIQGEGIMRKSIFEKYNSTAKEPLKNPRNGVAGAIRNLDTSVTASRKLDIMFYSIGYAQKNTFQSQTQVMDFLKNNGFKTSDFFFVSKDVEAIKNKIWEIDERRSDLDFLIDGVVIKINDFKIRQQLGFTEKFPRWAIAFKFEAEEVTTILKDVVWNVGRTGKLTPLGILEPVALAGATVSKATLNNMGDIERKGVKIGSRVLVRRSNDVIPEILTSTELHDTDLEISLPKTCPSCGSELVQNGEHIFCLNSKDCKTQMIAKITHFASKDAMDIEGFSEKTAKQLYEDLNVRSLPDLYQITKDRLLQLEGFKDKKAQNLINSIERSKKNELYRFVHAISIPNVGKKTAKQLAQHFKTFDNIRRASYDELIEMEDVGEIIAQSIIEYFKNPENCLQIETLFSLGVSFLEESVLKTGVFSGQKVVLTGSLETYSRTDAGKIIEDLGGEMQANVTSDTTLVVAGEKAGSKLEKAQKKNIKIIDESEFLRMIEKREDVL